MKSRIIAAAIIMCMAATACTKIIEFKGEETESKIVVNGVQYAGQKAVIHLSKSRFFLDNNVSDYNGADATVKLYLNGQYVEDMLFSTHLDTAGYSAGSVDYNPTYPYPEFFKSDTTLHEGDRVRFEVIVPNMETVTAEIVIPTNTADVSMETTQVTVKNTYGDIFPEYFTDTNVTVLYTGDTVYEDTPFETKAEFKLTFSDNGSERNFYSIGFDTYNVSTNEIVFNGDGFFDQINIDDNSETSLSQTNNVFSDSYFNGNVCTLKFWKIFVNQWGNPTYVTCSFMQVDEGYYNFVRTSGNYSDDELLSMFMEPTRVYSNVENGIGAVIGCSTKKEFTINLMGE